MNKKYKLTKLTTLVLLGIAICSEAYALEYNGPSITFEQVYENPDDNDLKLNYARQQAALGDLISAAGALEGMLYSQPDWDSARLFYAIVLHELDDRESAMREFSLLDSRPLTAENRKLLNSYRGENTEPTTNEMKVSGVLEVGVRTDNNAGNALFDSTIGLADESDSSAFVNGALNVAIPLLDNGDLKLNLGARGQTRRHSTFSTSDYNVIGASAGLSGEFSSLSWKAGLDFDNVYLSGEKYLTQMGPTLSVGKMVSNSTRLTVSASAYYQDFEGLSFSFGERFRSGNKHTLRANILTRVDENFNYGATVGYENKNATQNALAYDGFHIAGNVFKGFESGVYVKGQAHYSNRNYDALNVFTPTPTDRKDDQFSGRLGIGASLNKVGGWLGSEPNAALSRTYIETGVNYTSRSSNISIFEYENLGAELKLIWDF